MVPIEELTLRTASLTDVLEWLTQPKGPHLVDGTSTVDSLTALALLISPEALHDPDSPRVGLGLVYKAPYIQATSWSEAYYTLKLTSLAKESSQATSAKVIFVQIHKNSWVIPLPGVLTLFLDTKTTEEVTDSKISQPPQDFRGFKLHRVAYVASRDKQYFTGPQTEGGVNAWIGEGTPAHGGPLSSQRQSLERRE